GAANGTLTLAADGSFSYVPNPDFTGLDSFSYRVNDGADGNVAVVSITVGAVAQPAASVSGYVYADTDNSGTKDSGESGIQGITVTLTGTDDLNATVNVVTTTNASGLYTFPGIRPGSYTVGETQPAGYLDGKDSIGSPGGDTANDVFSNIILNASDHGANNNFGELLPATISGVVYSDASDDGLRNTGETGISGVTL